MAVAALLINAVLIFLALSALILHGSQGYSVDPFRVWQLPFPNIHNDTAGYPVIPPSLITHTVLFSANSSSKLFPGTFNHHPHVHLVNSTSSLLLISFSNGLHDEDADGQQVVSVSSADAGLSFTPLTVLFPPALLPGQHPSSFNASSLQRALCSEGFIQLDDGRLFALAELFGYSNVTGIKGEGTGWKATGFGRVARPISPTDGRPQGPPCWIQPSRFARALAGTPYDLTSLFTCEDSATLIRLLSSASNQPAWSWAALTDDHYVHADTNSSQIQEPTHGVPFQSSELCRFWRLVSATHNRTLYMECANTTDIRYSEWWNGTDETATGWAGPFPEIVPSNVPDAGSKEFLLSLPPPFTHLLISNPKPNGDRFPLTIATSTNNATFTAIFALHSSRPPPSKYTGGTFGYQYPDATIQHRPLPNGTDDGRLFIVFNVNKEDIHLSHLNLRDLPRAVGGPPQQSAAARQIQPVEE